MTPILGNPGDWIAPNTPTATNNRGYFSGSFTLTPIFIHTPVVVDAFRYNVEVAADGAGTPANFDVGLYVLEGTRFRSIFRNTYPAAAFTSTGNVVLSMGEFVSIPRGLLFIGTGLPVYSNAQAVLRACHTVAVEGLSHFVPEYESMGANVWARALRLLNTVTAPEDFDTSALTRWSNGSAPYGPC